MVRRRGQATALALLTFHQETRGELSMTTVWHYVRFMKWQAEYNNNFTKKTTLQLPQYYSSVWQTVRSNFEIEGWWAFSVTQGGFLFLATTFIIYFIYFKYKSYLEREIFPATRNYVTYCPVTYLYQYNFIPEDIILHRVRRKLRNLSAVS